MANRVLNRQTTGTPRRLWTGALGERRELHGSSLRAGRLQQLLARLDLWRLASTLRTLVPPEHR